MTERLKTIPFLKTVRAKYRRYACFVLGFRHFAEGRDGLRPVQRRALWAMRELGAVAEPHAAKTSKIAGTCFAAGTPVSTTTGPVAIEMIAVGDRVLTSRGESIVTETFVNPPTPMIRIDFKDGRFLVCTPDQEIKIQVGGFFFWKHAELLTFNDDIVVEHLDG